VKSFDLAAEQIARARRHLDVTRSASIFAERAVLVEGITDAIVLRAIGRIWAGEDRARRRFIDSLTITVVGSRIGPWLPALLVADGNEIVNKLAILCDSDGKPVPQWVERQRSAYFDVFLSEPTLEPSLAPGNDKAVAAVLSLMGVTIERSNDDGDEVPLEEALATYFAKKGKSRKAEFADAFAAYCDTNPAEVSVPQHFQHLFEFVWEGFIAEVTAQRERATVSSEG
jgi:putative ATP-dependent endonuclease of OLD family